MKSKIIAVSALLLLGLGHCAYAQQTVRGKVVDSEGVPLPKLPCGNVQPYSSSAPEPAAVHPALAAPKIAGGAFI